MVSKNGCGSDGKKKGGSIIQLGSIYGIVGQDKTIYKNTEIEENMTYSIIKGGITNFSRQMASYYGKYNIRVNTLIPGGVLGPKDTKYEQSKTFLKNYNKKSSIRTSSQYRRYSISSIILGFRCFFIYNRVDICRRWWMDCYLAN